MHDFSRQSVELQSRGVYVSEHYTRWPLNLGYPREQLFQFVSQECNSYTLIAAASAGSGEQRGQQPFGGGAGGDHPV